MRYCFHLFFIIISILNINAASAKDFQNLDGYFKTIKSDYKLSGECIKLKDGQVIILEKQNKTFLNNKLYLFNPKDKSIREIAQFDNNIYDPNRGILLNNGKILYAAPYLKHPAEIFINKYAAELNDDVIKSYRLNHTIEKRPYNVSIDTYKRNIENKAWEEYKKLPVKDKEREYIIPYLKKHPNVLIEYYKYKTEYDKSLYAQLFNPAAKTFEYTGKLNIRRNYTEKILLPDGKVLLSGGMYIPEEYFGRDTGKERRKFESILEIYNPDTGNFSVLSKEHIYNFIFRQKPILLNDNKIFYAGTVYDIKNNTYSKSKNNFRDAYNLIKLPDGNILFNRFDKINIYYPEIDEVKEIGQLLVKRGGIFFMDLYSDDIVLIYDGENINKCDSMKGYCRQETKIEIFNIKTGRQKILKQKLKKDLSAPVKLNSGELLFVSPDGIELFLLK